MMTYREKKARLLAYTRRASSEDYPKGLAYSIHFAYSIDGVNYCALHQNYGVLFAEAEISAENTIVPKCVKLPHLFIMSEGEYGILADRTEEDGNLEMTNVGSDEDSGQAARGYALFWKTQDFRVFSKPVLVEQEGEQWERLWKDAKKSELEEYIVDGEQVIGSSIEICRAFCDRIVQEWTQVHNTEIRVPDVVYASTAEEIKAIRAQAVYSDGSTASKEVLWNMEAVDFSIPGIYKVTGKVISRKYHFPLLNGYGDPVIFDWEGKWYFLGTNDNLNDIGIYVRESERVEELFAEETKEHLILGVDEEKGFVQTFWAPEFHIIGGKLYILFAVGGKVWGPQCYMMRLKEGGCIIRADDWEEPVKVVRRDGSPLSTDGITLDMTYLSAGRNDYVVWSYRKGIGTAKDTGSMLYIARIEDTEPWRILGDPILLSRPLFGWENVSGTINNEGPHGFVKDGKVYLTYSGGSANSYTYVVGLLTADEDADLTDPAVWEKGIVPVLSFYSVEGEYGPGHNAFFVDKDGNLMISYHAETSLKSSLRCDGIRRVHFDIQGEPVFDLSAERDLNPALEEVSLQVIVCYCSDIHKSSGNYAAKSDQNPTGCEL